MPTTVSGRVVPSSVHPPTGVVKQGSPESSGPGRVESSVPQAIINVWELTMHTYCSHTTVM